MWWRKVFFLFFLSFYIKFSSYSVCSLSVHHKKNCHHFTSLSSVIIIIHLLHFRVKILKEKYFPNKNSDHYINQKMVNANFAIKLFPSFVRFASFFLLLYILRIFFSPRSLFEWQKHVLMQSNRYHSSTFPIVWNDAFSYYFSGKFPFFHFFFFICMRE